MKKTGNFEGSTVTWVGVPPEDLDFNVNLGRGLLMSNPSCPKPIHPILLIKAADEQAKIYLVKKESRLEWRIFILTDSLLDWKTNLALIVRRWMRMTAVESGFEQSADNEGGSGYRPQRTYSSADLQARPHNYHQATQLATQIPSFHYNPVSFSDKYHLTWGTCAWTHSLSADNLLGSKYIHTRAYTLGTWKMPTQ